MTTPPSADLDLEVKICGLTDDESVAAAVLGGADYLGVVFYAPSPRAVLPARAAELFDIIPDDVRRVGLFVNPDFALLDSVMNSVRLDFFQLHGAETPEQVEAIRLEYGMPVIKAVSVASAADLAQAEAFQDVADMLLFDAKAPPDATRPGGNAQAFDWTLLHGRKWRCPWMLAGGLTAANVAEAARLTGAKIVDVSSGVEDAPGVKNPDKITAFLRACGKEPLSEDEEEA